MGDNSLHVAKCLPDNAAGAVFRRSAWHDRNACWPQQAQPSHRARRNVARAIINTVAGEMAAESTEELATSSARDSRGQQDPEALGDGLFAAFDEMIAGGPMSYWS